MSREPRARRAAGRPALVVPTGQDVPLTVLVTAETAPSRSLQALASRMAVHLGHGVQPWHPLEPATALAAIGRRIARGTVRLVVLPVSAGQDAARVGSAVDGVATAVFRRWPSVCVHRGISPGVDDLARLLGDRGREAAGTLGLKRSALGDAVAVIVDVEGASPARNAELAGLCRLVYEAQRFADVAYAFLDLATPSLPEIIRRWAKMGARAVVVIPRMVFASVMRRRIVQLAAAAGQAAGIPVTVARVLSPHPLLVGALVRRHVEAVRAGPVVSAGEVRTTPYLRPHLVPIAGHAHGPSPLLDLQARIAAILPPRYQAPDVAVSAAPMAAAPLQFSPDGQVAWDAMWQGFCELALAGGPPHRGTLLEASSREEVLANPERYAEVVRELARGVRLITGLDVVLDGPPGWIGVVCASEAMAAWLLRAIVVENILARREDRVLYLPAGPRFGLASEVRNVITALAKSHHYWIEHVAASADR